jgi:hypothetical protein
VTSCGGIPFCSQGTLEEMKVIINAHLDRLCTMEELIKLTEEMMIMGAMKEIEELRIKRAFMKVAGH